MATGTMEAPLRPVCDTGSAAARPYVNVGEAERWASVVGGGLLAAYGLSRPNLSGLALAALGGALVYRGATGHCDCYAALGLNTAGRGPATAVPAGAGQRVEASVTINRSAGDLYLYWRNFENLPNFMRHLRSVKQEGGRFRWTAEAPLGASVEWEAEIVNDKPGELIAWRSLPGSQVDTAGSVHFHRTPNGAGTEVQVEMKVNPPAGKAGTAVAWLFGDDVEQQVRDSLAAFKRLMESGEARTAREPSASRRW